MDRRRFLHAGLLGAAGLTGIPASHSAAPEGELLYNGIRLAALGRHASRTCRASQSFRPT